MLLTSEVRKETRVNAATEKVNALLVRHFEQDQHLILPQVASELRKLGVRSRPVYDFKPQLKHKLWALGRPTTVISLRKIKNFIPNWAAVIQQVYYDKIEELRKLESAGLPVPKWRPLLETEEPDLSDFEDFVVVKPAAGACGALVRIMRRNRVCWRRLEVEKLRASNTALIVQEYIHTGPWPTSYRVATVFGEPIYALAITADRKRPPFDTSKNCSQFFDRRTIVASSKGCVMTGQVPADVLQLGIEAHKAFPDEPFLAVDIVRDHTTGKLFFLEANTSGWSFILTNETAKRIEKEFSINLMQQFNAPKAIARGIYKYLSGSCLCTQEVCLNGSETT